MLPESEAPPLENLDEFKAYVAEQEHCRALRMYEPAWEDEETGEWFAGYWQVYVEKATTGKDGRMYSHILTVHDSQITSGFRPGWALTVETLKQGFESVLRENDLP